MRSVGDLEVEVMGVGEPVVVIQTALTTDELRTPGSALGANYSPGIVRSSWCSSTLNV